MRNKPLVFIDPTGKMGDYYTEYGQWVGSDGIKDDKVHVAKVNSTYVDNKGTRHWNVTIQQTLSITHTEFQARAATAYGESSAFRSSVSNNDLAHEMAGIAYVNQRNNVAYGANNAQAQAFMNTTPEGRSGTRMQLANFAIINQVTGGADPSNGATMWDGAEQALFSAKEKRTSVPATSGKGTWELHQNTMGWDISNQDHATWKANVGKAFKAPQTTQAVPGTRNAGKTRLHSTAVYGRTIFWRVTP